MNNTKQNIINYKHLQLKIIPELVCCGVCSTMEPGLGCNSLAADFFSGIGLKLILDLLPTSSSSMLTAREGIKRRLSKECKLRPSAFSFRALLCIFLANTRFKLSKTNGSPMTQAIKRKAILLISASVEAVSLNASPKLPASNVN